VRTTGPAILEEEGGKRKARSHASIEGSIFALTKEEDRSGVGGEERQLAPNTLPYLGRGGKAQALVCSGGRKDSYETRRKSAHGGGRGWGRSCLVFVLKGGARLAKTLSGPPA